MAGEDRIGAGFRYIYYGVADSSGRLQGNSGTAATNGTIQPLLRLRGARTFPVSIPDRDRVPVSGDDEPLVTFDFASEQLPSGVLATAVKSLDFEALCKSTSVESYGNLRAGSMGAGGEVLRTMMVLLMREAKKFEGSTKGTGAWELLMIPACTISPLGSDWEQRTFNPYNYSLSISKAGLAIYGASYTEDNRGTTELALDPIEADNPVMIWGGYANGVATSYDLSGYTPYGASGTYTHLWINHQKKTYTTDYTTVGTSLVLVDPQTDGDHIAFMAEIDPSELA